MAAEDIVSESLINLWETSKKEKVEYPLALLVQMLKNGSLNYLKHQDVKQAVSESISSKMDRDLYSPFTPISYKNKIYSIIVNIHWQ